MKLEANLEVINNLANQKGFKKNPPVYTQLSFAKDSASNKYFLIVNSTKKPTPDKYRLANNIDKIYCKFVSEGKATLVLKEPNFTLAIQKANVNKLKHFLKLVHLANSSQNIGDELNKLQTTSMEVDDAHTTPTTSTNKDTKLTSRTNTLADLPQFKKPVTSLQIRSRSEYTANFKAIITQNLKIKTSIGGASTSAMGMLTRLSITNCELKSIDKALFELEQLTMLDMSNNKLVELDNFSMRSLKELLLANNQIRCVGRNVALPSICVLDLSFNQISSLDRRFCATFRNLSKLRVNNNKIRRVYDGIGYTMGSLNFLYANGNELATLPYSCSYLRFEMVELHDNPLEFVVPAANVNATRRCFPTLVELCSRYVVNKR